MTNEGQDAINNPPQNQYKSGLILIGLTLIFSLGALSIASYNMQFNYELRRQLNAEQSQSVTSTNQLKLQLADLEKNIVSREETVKQMAADLQKKIDLVNQQVRTSTAQNNDQNQDWLLLKARYSLELAQINAHWSDNYGAAIALLQQADGFLKQVKTPQILELRQTIAKEINLLKATPNTDIAGLLSQLDAAQTSISNLTIQSTINETNAKIEEDISQKPNPSAWRAKLEDSVNLLEKLVIVRRNDEDIKPLMSPLFESILRESIKLNLQEAQWAILNNNMVVYQLSLKQAILNLKRTFDEKSPSVSALLQQLNDLQRIKLTRERPAIGLGLPLLNQMIDHAELLTTGEVGKGDTN